jgi:hypothetical protein
MKTKEEFLKAELNTDRLTPIQWTGILRAMEKYAQQQVKNLNIPAVMGELTCDSCGCHPNTIYTTSKGRFCERCKPAS